ncbi:MAG: ABC transporter ATP-binding protein [Actinomycetota bacterium]|jgi:ATP-binding cassette subfamily B multidrug efflux pump|nr:ABC transporter ATP-binding protein [Actinomycetota bacterium]
MAHGVSLRSLAKDDRPAATLSALKRLLGYLVPFKRELAIAMLWLLVSSAANAASPALTGTIIDRAVAAASEGGSADVLTLPVALVLTAAIVGWWAQRMQILVLGTIGQKALFTVREQVFAKIQDLSVAFFDDNESGDLMSRLINDIETLNSFLSQGFRRVLSATLSIVATLIGMMLVDTHLALATLAVVPFMLGTTTLFGLIARRAFRARQEAIGDVSSALAEELAGIKVAQAFNRVETNRQVFSDRNAANRDANITASAVSSAFSPALALISATATALVAAYGGWLAATDVVTIGVVVAFFAYARSFFNAVTQLSSLYAETQSALAGGERVFALLDTAPLVQDLPNAHVLGRAKGDVSLRGVTFRYGTGNTVLKDINLDVAAGQSVAVVGPTGAGKTTLINLVARFYDPVEGSVEVDGHDLRNITMASLRRNMGIVLQEPFLFTGTIRENIAYGSPDASDVDVVTAASNAQALEFIELLSEGLDTVVGERGATLSTGQRQLIAFARALLADPAILILDEATSSVDTRTELLIQEALGRILKGRTALIIAHRLSTVRDADRIVVVEDGHIVEDGTYDALMAAGGRFADLHAAQFSD